MQAGTLALDEQRLLFGFNHVYGGAGDDLARTGEKSIEYMTSMITDEDPLRGLLIS